MTQQERDELAEALVELRVNGMHLSRAVERLAMLVEGENGTPGLRMRLDRIEQRNKWMWRMVAAGLPAMIGIDAIKLLGVL